MKNVSKASFIIGIILIVCALVLGVLGFRNINGVMYVRHMGGFMSMSYTSTSSMTGMCLAMIVSGGFLFLGGLMLFILAAITCPCRGKAREEKKVEKKEEVPAPQPKAEPAAEIPCQCQVKETDTPEPAQTEEQKTETL